MPLLRGTTRQSLGDSRRRPLARIGVIYFPRMRGPIVALLAVAIPVLAADPNMTKEERANALQWLEQSRAEFLGALEGLTEAQWRWKPAADRWSVGEVAEHVVLAEAGQFANVKKCISATPDPDWEAKTKGKTERLVAVLAPRLGRAQAAEAIVPKGG